MEPAVTVEWAEEEYGGKHHEVAEACRARPRRWAILGDYDRSCITNIKSGKLTDFRPVGEWDARYRAPNIEVTYLGPKGTTP